MRVGCAVQATSIADADGIPLEVMQAVNARRKIAILRYTRLHWDRVETDSAKTASAYHITIVVGDPTDDSALPRYTIQFSFQFPSDH